MNTLIKEDIDNMTYVEMLNKLRYHTQTIRQADEEVRAYFYKVMEEKKAQYIKDQQAFIDGFGDHVEARKKRKKQDPIKALLRKGYTPLLHKVKVEFIGSPDIRYAFFPVHALINGMS